MILAMRAAMPANGLQPEMSEDPRPSGASDRVREELRRVLVTRYDVLARKLTQRLGSAELADDVLHDTYVKLERGGELGPVRDPFAYLIRIASNLASSRRTLERNRKTGPDDAALRIATDEAPDPERVAIARSQWAALKTALKSLPERTQAIFLAAWVEETPYAELAVRHGVTVRTIQIEIKRALEHCAAELVNR